MEIQIPFLQFFPYFFYYTMYQLLPFFYFVIVHLGRGHPANFLPKKVPMDTTILYLDGNIINELQNNTFIGRKNLQQLYLNNSALYKLQKRALAGLHSIEVIHLETNNLRTLHNEFDHLIQLKELYLQNNKLEYVANDTFAQLKALQLLRIDGNRLVNMMMFNILAPARHFPNLKSLSIGRNTWSCRCSFLRELSAFVSDNAVILDDSQDIYCMDGTKKRDIDFNSTSYCNSFEGKSVSLIELSEHIPLFFTALILIVMITILILTIVFREPLRIWLFAKCGIRICESTIGEDFEKLYDALFLYSEKDYELATREIASELEIRPPQLRICLQQRDLTNATYLQILESARASKRVVILLSRNFLQTEWSRYEVRNAVHEALKERPQKLVLLLEQDEFLEAESDLELLPYIKSRVVNSLKMSDKYFWEKLRYALPAEIQQQCNNYTLHNHHPMHHPPETIPKASNEDNISKKIINSHQTQSTNFQVIFSSL